MNHRSFLSNVCHITLPALPAICGGKASTADAVDGLRKIRASQDPRRACTTRALKSKKTPLAVQEQQQQQVVVPDVTDVPLSSEQTLPDMVWYTDDKCMQKHPLLLQWCTRWVSPRNVSCIRQCIEQAERRMETVHRLHIETEVHAVICSLASGAAVRHPPLRPLATTVGSLKGTCVNQLRAAMTTIGTPLLGNCAPVVLQLTLMCLASPPFRFLFAPLPNVQCDCHYSEDKPADTSTGVKESVLHDAAVGHMPSNHPQPSLPRNQGCVTLRTRRTVFTATVLEFLYALTHSATESNWVQRTQVFRNEHMNISTSPTMTRELHAHCAPASPLACTLVSACRYVADFVDNVDNSFANCATLILLFDGQPLFKRETVAKHKDTQHVQIEGVSVFATQCAVERPVTISSGYVLDRVTLCLDWVTLPFSSHLWQESAQMELVLQLNCPTVAAVVQRRFMDIFLFPGETPAVFVEDIDALFKKGAAWNKGPTNNSTLAVWLSVVDSIQEWTLQAGAVATNGTTLPASIPNYMLHGESAVQQGHPQWRIEMELLPTAINEWAFQRMSAFFTVLCDVISTSTENQKAVRQKLLLNPILFGLSHVDRLQQEAAELAILARLTAAHRIGGGAVSFLSVDPHIQYLRGSDVNRCLHKMPRSVVQPAAHLHPNDTNPSDNAMRWTDGSCTVTCKCDGLEAVLLLSDQAGQSFISFKNVMLPLLLSSEFTNQFKGHVFMFAEVIVRRAQGLQLLVIPHELLSAETDSFKTHTLMTHEQRNTVLYQLVQEWLAPRANLSRAIHASVSAAPLAIILSLVGKMGPIAECVQLEEVSMVYNKQGHMAVQFLPKRYFSGENAFRKAVHYMQLLSSSLNITCDGFIITPVAQRLVSVTPHNAHSSIKWKPIHTIDFMLTMAHPQPPTYRLELLNHPGGQLTMLSNFSVHACTNGVISSLSSPKTTRFIVPSYIDVSQLSTRLQIQLSTMNPVVCEFAAHLQPNESQPPFFDVNLAFVKIRESNKRPNVLISAMDNISSLVNERLHLEHLLSPTLSLQLQPEAAPELIRHAQNMLVRKYCRKDTVHVAADFGAGKGGTIDEWMQCQNLKLVHVVDINPRHMDEFRRRLELRELHESCCRSVPYIAPTPRLVAAAIKHMASNRHSAVHTCRGTGTEFRFHQCSFLFPTIHDSLHFIACFMCLQQAVSNKSELSLFVSVVRCLLAPGHVIVISMVDHCALLEHAQCVSATDTESDWSEYNVDEGLLLLSVQTRRDAESYAKIRWQMKSSQTAHHILEWATPVDTLCQALSDAGFGVRIERPFGPQQHSAVLASVVFIVASNNNTGAVITDYAWTVSLSSTCHGDMATLLPCKYVPFPRNVPGTLWWTSDVPEFVFSPYAGLCFVGIDRNLDIFFIKSMRTTRTCMDEVRPQSVANVGKLAPSCHWNWRVAAILACVQIDPRTKKIARMQCLHVYGIIHATDSCILHVTDERATTPLDSIFSSVVGEWKLTCVRLKHEDGTTNSRACLHRQQELLDSPLCRMHDLCIRGCMIKIPSRTTQVVIVNCSINETRLANILLAECTKMIFPAGTMFTQLCVESCTTANDLRSALRGIGDAQDGVVCFVGPTLCVCKKVTRELCVVAQAMCGKRGIAMATNTMHTRCQINLLPKVIACLSRIQFTFFASCEAH